MQRHALECYRIVVVQRDDCVIADLLACSLNRLKVLEYPTVELKAIGMSEVGDRVMPKSGPEHKGILPISSGEPVVSVAADQAVATIPAKKEIVAPSAVQGFSTIATSNDTGRIAAN